jgi:hypothetical protein
MNLSLQSIRAAGFALVVSALPQVSQAAPFVLNEADLLLGVRATGGTGSTQNVFFNLGNTVTIKNTPNQGIVGTIAADLSATFGANWFERTDLYFGVFGNRSNLSPALAPGTPPEEPGSTIYLSTQTTAAGAAGLRPQLGTSSLGNGGTQYAGMKGALMGTTPGNVETFTATASGATIMDQAIHPVSWNNSWTVRNPVPGAAFQVFTGGIQNNFGKAISVTEVLVDVQRMVPNTPTTYVTTVGINSGGQIRLFKAVAASAYDTWIATFPSITLAADKLITADPDKDGATNLEEFGFGGNPASGSDQGNGQTLTVDANSDSLNDITLTLEIRSGATFSASGNDLVSAAIDGVSYRIEGSTDLASWDSTVSVATPTLGSGSSSTGYVFKTFRLNAGNGLAGKGFLRASVTQ